MGLIPPAQGPRYTGFDGAVDLQRLLKRYPRAAELRDGTTVILRPLVAEDEQALLALFAGIPDEEIINLRDNVAEPTVVRGWCRHINYERVLPIIAEADGAIVADATLHRRRVGPLRDVGRLRGYVHPAYRRRGLGAVLLHELIEIARLLGLTQLAVELFDDQHVLIRMFRRYGFRVDGHLRVYRTVILVREIAPAQRATA